MGMKGEFEELGIVGELLTRSYNVLTPMVDLGIDCLVDMGNGKYKEIQV
jgi:hypothetical protein